MNWHLTLFTQGGLAALAQVLMIDVVLAGDNAVVIGLAAARVPPAVRFLPPSIHLPAHVASLP